MAWSQVPPLIIYRTSRHQACQYPHQFFRARIHVVIADFGLAADTANPSTSVGRAQLTAHVRTWATGRYVAPELLAFCRVEYVEDAALYDLSVDVWSAAVVTYEVVSLVRFIFCSTKASIRELESCIGNRLGDLEPWQSDIAEPWQSLIALGLKRRAEER